MGNILKIEAFAGLSGDMFLGALSGLAEAYESIINLPKLLHLETECEIRITDVVKTGIACKHIKIVEKHHHHHHNSEHSHQHEHHHHGRHLHENVFPPKIYHEFQIQPFQGSGKFLWQYF
jgi:uncharacterized protein (DUF111 family)